MLKLVFGCGYLGRRIARLWREAGHEVAVVTRSAGRAAELASEGYRAIVADVTDAASLSGLPAAETVLYAVGFDRAAGKSIAEVYAGGLRNALAAVGDVGRAVSPSGVAQGRANSPSYGPRVLYISSTGVYGQTDGDWVDETTPCEPTREGGRASLAAENLLRAHPLGGRSVVLRLAGIYGPDRIPRAADLLAGKPIDAPADGYLNLIHVEDAARIVVAAAELDANEPKLYCVSDGHPPLRREYYEELAQLLHAPPPTFIPPDEHSHARQRAGSDKRVSNRRMQEDLRVELRYPSYREGLAAIVK